MSAIQVESQYRRFTVGIERVLIAVSGFLLAAIAIIMFAAVVNRFIFGIGYHAVVTLMPVVLSYAVFFALPVGIRRGEHIAIGVLPSRLKGRPFWWLKLALDISLLICCVWLAYGGIVAVSTLMVLGAAFYVEIVVPEWLLVLCFPVGFVLSALVAIELLVQDVRQLGSIWRMP